MQKIIYILLPIIFLCNSCETKPVNSQQVENTNAKLIEGKKEIKKQNENVPLSKYFIRQNSLAYKGFVVKKSFRKSNPKDSPEVEIADLIIQKNGKILLKFDGIYYPLGNDLDFGLFSFLGGDEKQLAISDAIPRGGIHYIVSLFPQPKILFASSNWNVGREEFDVVDVDNDGIFEIILAAVFDEFEQLPKSDVLMTNIHFRYDKTTEKFLPANHLNRDFVLRGIGEQTMQINRHDRESQFADVLAVTLRYIYAGEEKQAWKFFDKEYNFDDREERKQKIKSILLSDLIYKFVRSELRKQ